MSEKSVINYNAAPEWEVESYYFGGASWPSSATYRRSGERIQRQIELELPVAESASHSHVFDASNGNARDFLTKFADCRLVLVQPSIIPEYADPELPSLFLIGWAELETPEEQQQYLRDKNDSM